MTYSLSDFIIDNETLENHKDLIDLIIASETISDKDQKQYWISAIDDMDDDQMESLLSILGEEQEGLKKIGEEFNEDLKKEEYEKEEAERLRRKREREEKEREAEEKESLEEQELLSELDNL